MGFIDIDEGIPIANKLHEFHELQNAGIIPSDRTFLDEFLGLDSESSLPSDWMPEDFAAGGKYSVGESIDLDMASLYTMYDDSDTRDVAIHIHKVLNKALPLLEKWDAKGSSPNEQAYTTLMNKLSTNLMPGWNADFEDIHKYYITKGEIPFLYDETLSQEDNLNKRINFLSSYSDYTKNTISNDITNANTRLDDLNRLLEEDPDRYHVNSELTRYLELYSTGTVRFGGDAGHSKATNERVAENKNWFERLMVPTAADWRDTYKTGVFGLNDWSVGVEQIDDKRIIPSDELMRRLNSKFENYLLDSKYATGDNYNLFKTSLNAYNAHIENSREAIDELNRLSSYLKKQRSQLKGL